MAAKERKEHKGLVLDDGERWEQLEACGRSCEQERSRLSTLMAASFNRVLRLVMIAIAATSLSQCATHTQKVSDEGSYTLGEKKRGEDPLSLHGEMEVSVGYDSGNFPDARRAMGGPARW